MDEIVNRVAASGIITIDLGEFYPEGVRKHIDLKEQLFQGLVLREKDFREFVSTHDWSRYTDAHVGVHCSADAIVPTWAYMLVASALSGIATSVHFADASSLEALLWAASLDRIKGEEYRDARVVIKGCGDRPVSEEAFMLLSHKLKPFVRSLMYGEPCSTVPVYKRKS